MGNIVKLSISQKSEVTKRIEERLNGKLGLNLKLTDELQSFSDNLNAVEVDLSVNDSNEVLGTQYIQTVLQNGESIELQYTEAKDVWLYQLNKVENNKEVVEQEFKRFKNSKDYQTVLDFLKEGEYDLAPGSKKVLNIEQYSFDEKSQKSTNNIIQALSLDIVDSDKIVGALVFGDSALIKFKNDDGVVVFNEDMPVIVPMGAGGKWKKCMADCIGCGSWESCVSGYSCLGACANCLNPVSCLFCLGCAVASTSCLWKCRMCVSPSSRPQECPVK
ncbi:hypothetical protein FC756_09535 [Lysinibacillus mangiferihumi]|uniref:Uncharacterized protein n=1 Tax=Lysinibacillus mangiferihumi TaxID=1130819 RepID=A0A4U2Z4K8_9BACI|nr:hypothetical protein [Lysinibacillus mangiferihumi]TKI69196.1 hypothetical protein FC756_09535 [Lysinibacillus mangiferihumi]